MDSTSTHFFHFNMFSGDDTGASEAPVAEGSHQGLLQKLKRCLKREQNSTASNTPEESPKLMTSEELEFEKVRTVFTDIIRELYPYHSSLDEKLKEGGKSFVDIRPVFLGYPLNFLSAELYDGTKRSIVYTEEKKCCALKDYLSTPQPSSLERVAGDVEMKTNDRSLYSQKMHEDPGEDVALESTAVAAEERSPPLSTHHLSHLLTAVDEPSTPATAEPPAFYFLLPWILIQNCLKDLTCISSIPTIHDIQISQDPTDRPSWFIEDNQSSDGVPIRLIPSTHRNKSDRLEICVNEKWIRLKGRDKDRFLDDLAAIQVGYSTITSEHLGPLVPIEVSDKSTGLFRILLLKDRTIIADIHPAFASARDYISSLSHDSFERHLLGKAADKLTLTTGPYPLCLPPHILSNILVDKKSGSIVRLSQSWKTGSGPWELAALPPLQLSTKAMKRYTYSLKRHYFGALVRNKTTNPENPKLHEFAEAEGREIWECIAGVGREDWVQRMVHVVLGMKDWEREKRKWEMGIIV